MNNFNFNSLTEVTNAIANSANSIRTLNKNFILIVDHIGEYTPDNWNCINFDDGVNHPDTNPLSELPEDLISAIQAWEQGECIANLIFIPLTQAALRNSYEKLYQILEDIAKDDFLGDDDYFDYIPEAFDILERILFGLAHTYEDPACAFDALKVHHNLYDLIKAYAKFSNNTYTSDDLISLISPHSYAEMISFKEDAQVHTI